MEIYKYWDQVGTMDQIETYVEHHDNNEWNCEPIKLDADVFYLVGYIDGVAGIFRDSLSRNYTKKDIDDILNKVFSTRNRKDIVVVYINSINPILCRAIQMLVNRLHLEGYEQVYLNYPVGESWVWETVEAL